LFVTEAVFTAFISTQIQTIFSKKRLIRISRKKKSGRGFYNYAENAAVVK
jgi:hypothetical protein